MNTSIKRWFVVVLLVSAVGTPLTLLQSVAWVGMLVKYCRQTTLAQAVAITFDGKHPCRLCHFVQETQANERQQQPKGNPQPDEQLQLGLPPVTVIWFHPPTPAVLAEALASPGARTYPPPVPPPRA